jgi:hypothetical protein
VQASSGRLVVEGAVWSSPFRAQAQPRPWPGASRAAWERFRAGPGGGERVSNAEALRVFEGTR